jgi:hypothetical protein
MSFQKIIFLILLLLITISISFIVGSIFEENIFNIEEFGFQFLIFSILGSFIFFSAKYLRNIDTLIIVLFLSSLLALLKKRTSVSTQIGGLFQLHLYTFMLFIVYALIFKLVWFRFKYIRNIMFSILEAIGYVVVHLVLHIIIKRPFRGQFILIYFFNGLKIMITLGVSYSIVEFLNSKLETLFFKTPERIFKDDSSEKKDGLHQ